MFLQVAVGPEVERDRAAQAALATVVNVGRRAFRGGVHVLLERDPMTNTGWTEGIIVSDTVSHLGGHVVQHLVDDRPTIAIGQPTVTTGSRVLHLTWRGWCGGVVQSSDAVLDCEGIVPAGIAAAALGVSEVFQDALGAVVATRRDIGVSL